MVQEMWDRLGEKDKELEQKRHELQDNANKHMQALNELNKVCFEKQKLEDDNDHLRRKVESLRCDNDTIQRTVHKQSEEIELGSARIKELSENADNFMSLWETSNQEMEDQMAQRTREFEKDKEDLRRNLELEYSRKMEGLSAEMRGDMCKEMDTQIQIVRHEGQVEREQEVERVTSELKRKFSGEMDARELSLRATLEEDKKQAISELTRRHEESKHSLESRFSEAERQFNALVEELQEKTAAVERLKQDNYELKDQIHSLSASSHQANSLTHALQSQIDKLQHQADSQTGSLEEMRMAVAAANAARDEACARLLTEETKRRKLHNEIQELRGNIRVISRVRPVLPHESNSQVGQIEFQDDENMAVITPQVDSITGNMGSKPHPFKFDKVFSPSASNHDVFLEVSQLVQSALDGFNVCIFAYGQTGSGKTHTMSGPGGVIPETINLIFQQTSELGDKGWDYEMTGQFIEIYNENLNDLLGSASEMDSKKLEIRHDIKSESTAILGVEPVPLSSSDQVSHLLRKSDKNRMVAATKANERSSRSHSVFIITLRGQNSVTGEKCDGRLNLIDLAGSERLNHSQATGDRLKETQSINKSLSCLGDVIHALGSSKEGSHIPYRNSKLTYLLQYSLGGNSKTLMLVNVSPIQAHANETINSLRFATKVNNTHIGKARKN